MPRTFYPVAPFLYRLHGEEQIRFAHHAGELGWQFCAEFATLAPGAWIAHSSTVRPVTPDTVVEIEGADGSRHVDLAGALVWHDLPADEGLIVRYRVLHPRRPTLRRVPSAGRPQPLSSRRAAWPTRW